MKKGFIQMAVLLLLLMLMGACGESPPTAMSSVAPETTQTLSPATPTPLVEPTTISDIPDSEAMLSLVILEPTDETVVNSSRITVSGTTRSDAVVSINGQITDVDSQGDFVGEVNLDIGPNVIEVIASDFYGNEESAVLAVVYAAALPLTVAEPLNESVVTSRPIAVKGVTSIDAVVSVNDDIVTVDASGSFSALVSLEEGPNFIEVVASDFNGHSSTVTLTVIYIP